MPLGDLSRDELIDVVRRIQSADGTEAEQDRLVRLFDESVPHPGSSDLIFWPEHVLGPAMKGRVLPAEEIVDRALSYKAIEL